MIKALEAEIFAFEAQAFSNVDKCSLCAGDMCKKEAWIYLTRH